MYMLLRKAPSIKAKKRRCTICNTFQPLEVRLDYHGVTSAAFTFNAELRSNLERKGTPTKTRLHHSGHHLNLNKDQKTDGVTRVDAHLGSACALGSTGLPKFPKFWYPTPEFLKIRKRSHNNATKFPNDYL
jgi:hypothetical protein